MIFENKKQHYFPGYYPKYIFTCQTAYRVSGKLAAPTKLKFTDKSPITIDISWGQPTGGKYFDIDGYVVSYKTISDAQYKTERILSNSLNLELDNLESETLYVIKVHGFNDDGDGEHSEIEVKTDSWRKFRKRMLRKVSETSLFKTRLMLTLG